MRTLLVIALLSTPALAGPHGGGGRAGRTTASTRPATGVRSSGPSGSVAKSTSSTRVVVQPHPTGANGGGRGHTHRGHGGGGEDYSGGYAYYGYSEDCGCDDAIQPVAVDAPPRFYVPTDDTTGLDQPRVETAPHVAIDCLDIAVSQKDSRAVRGIVLAYDVRNRCDAPVAVDLGSTVVASRTPDGTPTWLAAFDPQHDLGSFWIPALGATSATITYTAQTSTTTICVDAASLAGRSEASWLCLE